MSIFLAGLIVRLMAQAKASGDSETWARLKSLQRSLPSLMPDDERFRRLHYVRYADDFILGFTGPKAEATEIKDRLGEFLKDSLKLELSPEKTLVTHARTEKAQFLGYEIGIMHADDKVTPTRSREGATDFTKRCINGQVWLGIPTPKVDAKCQEFMIGGKIRKRLDQMGNSEHSIVSWYQSVYRGFANYYLMAHDVSWKVSKLKWVMTTSMLKTLAAKRRSSCRKVAREIRHDVLTPDGPIRAYQVRVPRPGRDDLVATFGGISLRRRESVILDDAPAGVYNTRTELLERLLRDACELCGSERGCEVHHVRKIADLREEVQGQPGPLGEIDDHAIQEDPGRLPGLPREDSRRQDRQARDPADTGEPNAVKAARWVREGAVGKGSARTPRRRPTSPLGAETGRPTLILDVGSLLGSLVGQSEANTRQALRLVDAMSPCVVMIDEVEKALAGASGASGDSGVAARLFGTLLSWLNDRTSDSFVVCTSNDISKLPPEFARSERFDATFFLDLPGPDEKAALWWMYLVRFGLDPSQARPNDRDWTPAEIKACCRLAALLDVALVEAATNIVPVAVTAGESVERLRSWAAGRCLAADRSGLYTRATEAALKPGRNVRRDPSSN
jgi:ATPase family associated with various cellular activities (AAA)/Type II intron maturase/Reverse transcriptase (RNA-dependent DNA polymerase)